MIDLLLQHELVSRKDLAEAAALQEHGSSTLAASLIRLGAISEEALAECVSTATGATLLKEAPPVEQVIIAQQQLKFTHSWLAEHEALIWLDESGQLNLVTVGGEDRMVSEAAEQWQIASSRRFVLAHRTMRSALSELEDRRSAASTRLGEPMRTNLEHLAEDAPAIEFVNAMLAEALARKASDIHIEPFKGTMQIRMRIDGSLALWRGVPAVRFAAIASRIKLLCGMDIAERRIPQDGRHSVRVGGRNVDIRASCLPGVWGESIVLRFLGRTVDLPSLAALGLNSSMVTDLQELSYQPSGLLLVSGPTGSGKTTTVYKLLEGLNDGTRKIITVEDPVEIDLPGVIQVNVRQDIGLEFATGLRAILRQDPDVIFVGEIRDSETARIAVRAALTGHLVISTVHTGSAVASVARLLDLGIEGYLLAEAISGVLAQRLLRRLTNGGPERYAGRVGIYELLSVTSEIRDAIRTGASQNAIERLAAASGFANLRADAHSKVQAGLTDEAEVLRVLGN
ncbi:type II/IV secretion system protein [Novosphingobium sp. MW5]|nr:type II/IV secretion system protein [Novosphingobium sp. MW5]